MNGRARSSTTSPPRASSRATAPSGSMRPKSGAPSRALRRSGSDAVDRDKLMEQRRYFSRRGDDTPETRDWSGAGEASRAGRRQRRGKKSEDGAVPRRRISASPRRHEGRLLHSVARTKGEKPRLRGRQWIWQAAAAAALKINKRAGNETRERGWSDGQQLKSFGQGEAKFIRRGQAPGAVRCRLDAFRRVARSAL